ncbi:MAG: hypothetical protein U0X93_05810 [Anaerolineales bacterium]
MPRLRCLLQRAGDGLPATGASASILYLSARRARRMARRSADHDGSECTPVGAKRVTRQPMIIQLDLADALGAFGMTAARRIGLISG